MVNKKGQGFHQASGLDLVILLIGVVIGMVLIYFMRDSSFVQDLICPIAPVA